jgi:hypothetical protein
MNIRQSVFGQIAVNPRPEVFDVDVSGLLRRLLLFDTVVVQSLGLREIPTLIRTFGKSGFLHLFNSGILKVSAELTFLITDVAQNGVRQLQPLHFSFGVATIADRKAFLKRGLLGLQGVAGLHNDDRAAMEEAIVNGLIRPPADYGAQLQAQVESDLRCNAPALSAALRQQLRLKYGDPVPVFELHVEEPTERTFHLVNDLPKVLGISQDDAHKILHSSVSAVANLNQRLADMEAYSSIVGFTEVDAPLLFGKLAGVISPQNPKPLEEQFSRVMTIANFPDFPSGKKINVDALLSVRESVECREFRAWLSRADSLSDKEIQDLVAGYWENSQIRGDNCDRTHLGCRIHSRTRIWCRRCISNRQNISKSGSNGVPHR